MIRTYSTMAAVFAMLTACATAPAHADALPPRHQNIIGGPLYDPPLTGSSPIAAPVLLASWQGAPAGWNPPGIYAPSGSAAGGGGRPDTYGDGRGASCERGNASFCRPSRPDPESDVPGVPGPIGVVGAAAAFAIARRIRGRVKP